MRIDTDKSRPAGDNQAARLLRRLADAGVWLKPKDGNGEGEYQLVRRDGKPDGAVRCELVQRALSQGWIAAHGGEPGLRLTPAGASWLKRRLAGEDAFRAQHQLHAKRPLERDRAMKSRGEPVLVNDAESPLGWLARRKDKDGRSLIDAAELQAGERLRADFTFALMQPRVTANWQATGGGERRGGGPGGMGEMRAAVLAARQRVRHALEAVGPELSGILLDVCCLLHGLEQLERTQGWPQRSAKVLLKAALGALARHYGLISSDVGRTHLSRALQQWGTDDFRPTLESWDQPAASP